MRESEREREKVKEREARNKSGGGGGGRKCVWGGTKESRKERQSEIRER